jgi:signal transduction histidine kinase/ActR/RegA family two-component response regulator
MRVGGLTLLLLFLSLFLAARAQAQSHNHQEHLAQQAGQNPIPTPENDSFFGGLFKAYTPRQVCMNNEKDVVWLSLVSDALIAAAYYSIPIALIYFVKRRKDLSFNYVFLAFAAFILACGTTHVLNIIAIWHPVYRFDGLFKAFTAAISVATAIALWPLLPKALRIPSPAMLQATNAKLEAMTNQLERRVSDRTAELERANENERRAREVAENASRMKDDFVATLSHELRTPMGAILGWTQVLQSPNASKEDLAQGLEIIERNTKVQSQLIEDLLDMSRILAGKLRLDIQPVDLNRVILSAVDTVQAAAIAKDIRIETQFDPVATTVTGDPNRLQQIVWNLLSNAVKFTPRGGLVNVRLRHAGSHIVIVVSDNGAGIKPEFFPHMFERFRQQDSSTTRRHTGLGLGLAIVRQLVELHGGSVRADSAGENKGATFTVELPITAANHPAADASPDRKQPLALRRLSDLVTPSLQGVQLLVIDDDPDTRMLFKRILDASGARVTLAGSAREAYARIRELRPNVILSDISMPEEDGFTLIKTVRSWPAAEGGATPAVALTAFASAEDRRRALLMGFQMHVAKPVEPAELIAVVASVAGITGRPGVN